MLVLFYSSFMNKFMYCILVDRGDYTNVRVHILLDYIFVYGGKYFFRLVLVRSYRQTENKNSRQFWKELSIKIVNKNSQHRTAMRKAYGTYVFIYFLDKFRWQIRC